MKKYLIIAFVALVTFTSCGGDDESVTDVDNFDRKAMLINWADNLIVPAYAQYASSLDELSATTSDFITNPGETQLESVRNAWLSAYTNWQKISMFEIGPAESVTLRDFSNIFPTDADLIENFISDRSFNLELPSSRTAQGFPALDYLLFGIAETDEEIVQRYSTDEGLREYLGIITDRLNTLGNGVYNEWQNSYRDTFVGNDGSSANSSVNKLVNDYMYYYEKALRAGKIGIPAGVFSNKSLPDRVEGYYSRNYSKQLFLTALTASKDFFNGKHFSGNGTGKSLKSYLDFLNSVSNGESLSKQINNQFDTSITTGGLLANDLSYEVENNTVSMLRTYDELQKNVILLKVDMFQAMSVKVDFVDADGD